MVGCDIPISGYPIRNSVQGASRLRDSEASARDASQSVQCRLAWFKRGWIARRLLTLCLSVPFKQHRGGIPGRTFEGVGLGRDITKYGRVISSKDEHRLLEQCYAHKRENIKKHGSRSNCQRKNDANDGGGRAHGQCPLWITASHSSSWLLKRSTHARASSSYPSISDSMSD